MNEYNTDILKITCSCPDWKETRKQYSIDDPRRLCKHIINKLNINNLPHSIAKFEESIKFYQEKEWGFKRNFDEIIELDSFTLFGNIGWIDVFDENHTRYGVKKDYYSNNIYWANNLKPKNHEIIEKYLIKESEKIPLPLEDEEYPQIINFIKEVLPNKKDFYLSIHDSQYVPTSDGIIYDIYESKLTPEQKRKLEQELLQKYEENEAYYKLGEADLVPVDRENEFSIYQALTVTNEKILLGMDNGKKYIFKRNYEQVKQLIEAKELKEKLNKEEQEKLWQEKLKEKRRIATEKGYLLSEDYNGKIYDIQRIHNHPDRLSWDEYERIKNSILGKYDTLQNLIKEFSLNITTTKFNKILKDLNFITKESSLNQNDWVIKNDGLLYGINLIKESKYMHDNIPDWYTVHIFDNKKMKLTNLDSKSNIKMTSILFKKNKFNELYELITQEIKNQEGKIKIKSTAQDVIQNSKQLERIKWLRHVNCPNCGEKTNIHKKDKRKRTGFTIQRFYCNECKSIFQMDINELEKLIKEYKIISSKETMEVQSIIKEESIQIFKNKENKSNFFKKFFSFFK